MRANLPAFDLVTPRDLTEALALLAAEPGGYRALAGGTDLMVLLAAGTLAHRRYLNIWHLTELRGIQVADEAVTLGALTTYSQVLQHPVLASEFPMLGQAARETGGWAIQNRGTLGGNIGNASPAADSPPALLAYGAELVLVSQAGARTVPYDRFHTGYKQTVLRPDELIAHIRIPRWQGHRVHFYRKVGPRQAQAISKVCFAGCADVADGRLAAVRIALGGVAPVVVRCQQTEQRLLAGAPLCTAQAALLAEIAPIDDVRSSAAYRRRVSENLLAAFTSLL
jgi:CO/xanthine dehydrogenase FAD-binding subunit